MAALADAYRVIAIDLPGFGESDKPIGAPYDAPWFARAVFDTWTRSAWSARTWPATAWAAGWRIEAGSWTPSGSAAWCC